MLLKCSRRHKTEIVVAKKQDFLRENWLQVNKWKSVKNKKSVLKQKKN